MQRLRKECREKDVYRQRHGYDRHGDQTVCRAEEQGASEKGFARGDGFAAGDCVHVVRACYPAQMSRVVEAKEIEAQKTVALASWLLGKHLVRRLPSGVEHRARIIETEAYDGERDLACHAARGRTPRTDVLYSRAGTWYVYLCYGIHEMLNLVAGPEDWPAAVLIRGVEGTSGTGRLTRAWSINRSLNRTMMDPVSGLWIEDDGVRPSSKEILRTPRIGVDYAGPLWAAKPWRFLWVSPAAVAPSLSGGPRARVRASTSPSARRS